MIVTSVLLLTPPDDGPRVKGKRFELEDILGDDFKIPTFNGTWVTGECWQVCVGGREGGVRSSSKVSMMDCMLGCV